MVRARRRCSGDPDQPRRPTSKTLVLTRSIPGWATDRLRFTFPLILSPKVYTWTWLNDCCYSVILASC